MQTRPSCSLEPYALIEFVNYTEINKVTYIQRYYDNKPLGEPVTNIVEPKTRHTYRVPPGYYEFGVKKVDGTVQAYKTREAIGACGHVTINMSIKTPLTEPKIKSRRSGDGIS